MPQTNTEINIYGFTVTEEISLGGTSIILIGNFDPEFGLPSKVVVKVAKKGQYEELLRIEAQVLSQFSHPNVPAIYPLPGTQNDFVGTTKDRFGDDRYYIVLQHIEGMSLLEYVDRNSLGSETIFELLEPIAECLSALHQRGICHCDVKPENIVIGSKTSYLLDFGSSQKIGEPPVLASFTRPYASQSIDLPVQPSSDTYSLIITALVATLAPRNPSDILTPRNIDQIESVAYALRDDVVKLFDNTPALSNLLTSDFLRSELSVVSVIEILRENAVAFDAAKSRIKSRNPYRHNSMPITESLLQIFGIIGRFLLSGTAVLAYSLTLALVFQVMGFVPLGNTSDLGRMAVVIAVAILPVVLFYGFISRGRGVVGRVGHYHRTLVRAATEYVAPELNQRRSTAIGANLDMSAKSESQPSTRPIPEDEIYFRAYHPSQVSKESQLNIFAYAHLAQELSLVEQDLSEIAPQVVSGIVITRAPKPTRIVSGTPIAARISLDDERLSPDAQIKIWNGKWLRFAFSVTIDESLVGKELKGCIYFEVFGIEVATLPISVLVATDNQLGSVQPNPLTLAKQNIVSTKMYQKIFVSYSRKDMVVVDLYRQAQLALGNDVFVDRYSLRSGEDWQAGLAKGIDEADVFQLFWSDNSSASPNVKHEWTYALEYKCKNGTGDGFIRPVFWRQPLSSPPLQLQHLNFRFVDLVQRRSEMLEWVRPTEDLTLSERLDDVQNKLDKVLEEIRTLKEKP